MALQAHWQNRQVLHILGHIKDRTLETGIIGKIIQIFSNELAEATMGKEAGFIRTDDFQLENKNIDYSKKQIYTIILILCFLCKIQLTDCLQKS